MKHAGVVSTRHFLLLKTIRWVVRDRAKMERFISGLSTVHRFDFHDDDRVVAITFWVKDKNDVPAEAKLVDMVARRDRVFGDIGILRSRLFGRRGVRPRGSLF